MAQKIYRLVAHKIPNITVYFVKHYYIYIYISRDIDENVWKKWNIIE